MSWGLSLTFLVPTAVGSTAVTGALCCCCSSDDVVRSCNVVLVGNDAFHFLCDL